MLKVGIIGLGGIAGIHISAYKKIDGVKVVAVADSMGKSARSYGLIENSDVRLYTDACEMLRREKLDIVDICAPTHLHEELSIKALSMGFNVICEKPMAMDSGSANRILDAANASGKIFMVAHVLRFSNPYAYLHHVIKSGELGAPVSLSMQRLSEVPAWRRDGVKGNQAKNGDVVIDLAIHEIDFVNSIFGKPDTINGAYRKATDGDANNYVSFNLTYGKTAVNILSGFYTAKIPFRYSYRAIFENGYVYLADDTIIKNGEPVDALDVVFPGEAEGMNIELTTEFTNELEYFIDCVKKGEKPLRAMPESTATSINLAEKILANTVKL